MSCKIIVKNQDEEYARYELEPGVYSIGSSSDNQISLPLPGVEAFHAEIEISADGRVFVRDAGSKAGLIVNGEPISESTLPIYSKLQIGSAVIQIEEQEITEEVETYYEFSSSGKIAYPVQGRLTPIHPSSNQSEEPEAASWGASFLPSLAYPFSNYVYLTLIGLAIILNLPIKTDEWEVDLMIKLFPWYFLIGIFFNTVHFATENIPAKDVSLGSHMESSGDDAEFIGGSENAIFYSEKFKVCVMFLLCLGPAMCINVIYQGPEWKVNLYTCIASVVGSLYLIIPLLALSMTHSIDTLNPIFVVRSFFRIPGPVSIMGLCLVGIIFGNYLVGFVIWTLFQNAPLSVLVIFGMAHSSVFYYCLLVWCRMLGLMYYYHQDELNWTMEPEEF